MSDAFDRLPGRDSAKGDAFDKFPIQEESLGKSLARTALQIPQGVAEVTTPGLVTGLHHFLGMGEVFDPEEIDRLKEISKREGIPFNEEAYMEAAQQALGTVPTVSNIASSIEKRTGLPLEPKEWYEKALRLGSSAGKLQPGTIGQKATASIAAPVISQASQAIGIPEPFADLAGLGFGAGAGSKGPSIDIGKARKPSGMVQRVYEGLEKPTEVSQRRLNKINQTTEKEFRDLTNQIIETSPVKEAYRGLENDVAFKETASQALQNVQTIAEGLPNQFQTPQIKKDLASRGFKKKSEGLTPSEFDKEYNKFIQNFIKETPDKAFAAKDLVKQYRKNNGQLSEAYEPGQSFAYNRAKRESLLEYNRAIADMIEKEFPNSEFSNLFKETNKRWADISNAETISSFLDQLFEGKINYKTAKQLFDKNGATVPFERAMGKEGFGRFKTLLNDLLSTEKGYKLLKVAEQKGYGDLAKTAGAYILHPHVAKAKLGYDTLTGGYKKIFEMVLDKPKLAITWDRGINAMKKGDFKAAEQEFKTIKAAEQEFDVREKSRKEALGKFNDKIKKAKASEEVIDIKPIQPNEKTSEPIKKQVEHKTKAEEVQEPPKKYREKPDYEAMKAKGKSIDEVVEMIDRGELDSQQFRDRFMSKKDVGVSERLDKMGKPKPKKRTEIELLDEQLSKAYDKLMDLDEEFRVESRSKKPIDPKIRSEKIKKFNAAQKRVDDLRDEIDRASKFNERKKDLSPVPEKNEYLDFLNEKGEAFKKEKFKEFNKNIRELEREISEIKEGKHPYYSLEKHEFILNNRKNVLEIIKESLKKPNPRPNK